ncbi:MAG TPA: TIGR03086 family metal-binding protein [Ilumatobacteraceae bacterium]|nr:TIGR03086 family metal-binding protein [Ilumatobacteraceae bacterium]
MDAITVFKRALDQTGGIVSAVELSQLDDSTPCDEWNVKQLLNHTIAVVKAFGDGVQGKGFDASLFAADQVGSDPAASYNAAAAKLHEALDQPGVLDGNWTMPFGATPAAMAVAFCTLEVSQHGWDVAKATGQHIDFDPEVAEVAMATAQAAPAEMVRNPGVFGPEIDCPGGAPLQDRVAAFVGRQL